LKPVNCHYSSTEQMLHPIIEENRVAITEICEQQQVQALYFFGSVVDLDRFHDHSDIDILVSFHDNLSPETYTECYFQLLFDLETLLEREIDITTARSVKNPYFRAELDRTKELFFEAIPEVHG
jgi:predicted nucleotidyltransferase